MKNISNFLKNYVDKVSSSILESNIENINAAAKEIIKTIKRKGTIFVCGNGGSAAIANHYVVDFIKFFKEKTDYKPKIISLSNSIETITAIANDLDYKKVFSYQAENLCEKKDLILIISSSGNSKNIVEILKHAKKERSKP